MSEASSAGNYFASGARVGDYTIDQECSVDQAGVVYHATHLVLPRKVCLKVMAGQFDRESAVQLLREACLLEALAHAGVPRVFECGVLPDRRPWVAFERVGGRPMSTVLSTGPMPMAELVVVLRDAADVLHHAHTRGVVHRKLSGETIMRTPERPYSICIYGWAGARTIDSVQHLDAREDVYALGAIAFRALTGCLHTPSVSATEWCPAAPGEMTALIDVMLDPKARVRPTMEEVRERARWLATTIEPLEIAKPRWTPPNGLDRQTHEPVPTSSSFSIRIGRSRTGQ